MEQLELPPKEPKDVGGLYAGLDQSARPGERWTEHYTLTAV